MSQLDVDKKHGWFQSSELASKVLPVVQHNTPSVPPSSPAYDVSSRQPRLVPTAGSSRPLPNDVKYLATTGPLSSEMKYPETHAVPHCSTSRSSYRRTRHGSIGPRTVDRDLHRVPAARTNFLAGGSLHRKSSDSGRPREVMFSPRHVGLPPGDCSLKHDLLPAGDWSPKHDRTAASELEFHV